MMPLFGVILIALGVATLAGQLGVYGSRIGASLVLIGSGVMFLAVDLERNLRNDEPFHPSALVLLALGALSVIAGIVLAWGGVG